MSDETDSQSVPSCSSIRVGGEGGGGDCERQMGDGSGKGVTNGGLSPGGGSRFFFPDTTAEKKVGVLVASQRGR